MWRTNPRKREKKYSQVGGQKDPRTTHKKKKKKRKTKCFC
jgi:hypothetical protein